MTQYFHGSSEKFKKFAHPKSGKDYGAGIYLTLHRDEAIQYAFSGDQDGFIYKVSHQNLNSFDTTNISHARRLKRSISASSPLMNEKMDDRYKFLEDESGFDRSMKYSLYHQVRSMFGLDFRDSREFNLYLLDAGFDSIVDPVKGWLIILRPETLKITSTESLKISEYDFKGDLGDMKFIKKALK